MSKELDQIRQSVANRQQELNTIAKNKQLEEQRILQERTLEKERLAKEKEKRSENNKNNIEKLGVINLLREIVDTKLVVWQKGPVTIKEKIYRESFFSGQKKWVGTNEKTLYNLPARIEWGEENCGIILGFDYFEWSGSRYESGGSNYKTIGLFLPDKFDPQNPTLEACSSMADEYPSEWHHTSLHDGERKLKKPDNQQLKSLSINEIPSYIAQEISKTIN